MILPVPHSRDSPTNVASRDYVSWSAFTTYQHCPLKYFFRYVAGLPEPTISSTLIFGAAIHQAVEFHFNALLAGEPVPATAHLFAQYQQYWQRTGIDTEQLNLAEEHRSLHELAYKMLTAFQASTVAQPSGKIIGVEETLRGALIENCPDVLGRVDLVVEEEQDLVITDFKTSRSRWQEEQVREGAGQLLLYAELIKDWLPHKRIRLQFAVITKTKQPVVEIWPVVAETQAMDRNKRILGKIWEGIERQHFYPAPSHWHCSSCAFKTACDKWPG
jgi:putative RecB family exonuclease